MCLGITIGAVVVPQGMAYAKLAELPVQFGLYSSFMGVLIYWFFATSKDITIGVGLMLLHYPSVILMPVLARRCLVHRHRQYCPCRREEASTCRGPCYCIRSRYHWWRNCVLSWSDATWLDCELYLLDVHLRVHYWFGHKYRRGPGSDIDGHYWFLDS